jgi:ABC-2 type transport system ATP-binding protein
MIRLGRRLARRLWPRGWRARLVSACVVIVVLAAAVAGGVAAASGPGPVTARQVRVSVTDGPQDNQHVTLDATFFTPSGTARVPVILLAHGFGQTKDDMRPEAEILARSGFAVLTWSARGFGNSTGQIALDSPNYEVKDVEGLVSWLAAQPRVLLDHPGDPRVGIAGDSYGGAIALLAAAYDHRIDAVVAQSTWNNLATALFPNALVPAAAAGGGPADGVFKKQWASLLFSAGASADQTATAGSGSTDSGSASSGGASFGGASSGGTSSGGTSSGSAGGAAGGSPCGRFLPSLCSMYQQIAQTGKPTPQAIATLEASSPSSVASRMKAPTLLVQGEQDSLFGLDQADANYQALRHNGAPADMVWYAGGHDGGDQETARIDGLTADWFHRWLGTGVASGSTATGSAATGQPGFAVSRTLGLDPTTGSVSLGVAAAGRYPGLNGTRQRVVPLSGAGSPGGTGQAVVNPAGGAPAAISSLPGVGQALGLGTGVSIDIPGQYASFTSAPLTGPLQLTGSATVRLRVTAPEGATLFVKLYDLNQAGAATLPAPVVAPVRVAPSRSAQVITVRLGAMDYDFSAGDRLEVAAATTDSGYATSPVPSVAQVALAGTGITVPEDPSLTLVSGGLPWWTWAVPVVAVLAAILLLATGRRRQGRRRQGRRRGAGDPPGPALAGVPLVISGLTKRYQDGYLAVDGVSITVERGQIVGLLGPNGAGKTTTLRMLMGLLLPDEGTITVFGRRVRPGSAALARLGSFVEGPGFLPHLSGRANLDLYWRATGRPAASANLAEVLTIAGLGTAIDRPVRTYSRGMKQRLAIAQAMLGQPDLLVLDEPMNGLDPPQIREMRDVLLRYAADGRRAVIVSSHLLGEVEQTCTHVVVMNGGRRIAAGPVADIVGRAGGLVVGTAQADRAASVLAGLAGIGGVEAHPDGVLVRPNGTPVSDVVAALVGAGVPVERVDRVRRLEEAFLELVSASGGAPPDAASPGTASPGPAENGEQ